MQDDYKVPAKSAKDIADIARAVRELLGQSKTWILDLINLRDKLTKIKGLEGLDFVVLPEDQMHGALAYTTSNPPRIFLGQKTANDLARGDGRARWTLAHEMGHLLMHPGAAKPRMAIGNARTSWIATFESAEWQADEFAANVLMPEEIVIDAADADELMEMCGVTKTAAERRFNSLVTKRRPRKIPQAALEIMKKLEEGSKKPFKY